MGLVGFADAPARLVSCARISVVGSTGAGKTTLARQLASLLDLQRIELDALHWEPGWTPAETATFRARVAAAVTGERWVVDGNYHAVRDLVWARAEAVVWLDYSLSIILARLARRTARRVATREELWNGNRETFRGALLSRDSLLVWALTTYQWRRQQYTRELSSPERAHLLSVPLHTPSQTRALLAGLAEQVKAGQRYV